MLIGDDGVMLEAIEGRLIAHPHPNTRGLLEIRNLGLTTFPVRESVEVALLITFDQMAPRFIETAPMIPRQGVGIPCVAIWPEANPPALKVEQALRRYGLPI